MTDKRQPRILLADDEELLLHVLAIKFTRAGLCVLTAKDGQEAWDKCLLERPDLLLVDYQMPVVDGLELCTKLLAHPDMCNMPVMVITTPWCHVADQFRALANVKDMIDKPFSSKELLVKVQRLVGVQAPKGAGQDEQGQSVLPGAPTPRTA
jgi:chemosensory pili system protein ChpA (sensor histidine kinase/response regulator)